MTGKWPASSVGERSNDRDREEKGRLALGGFLAEEGVLDEATEHAFAWQVEETIRTQNLIKIVLAESMRTSRARLNRALDPGRFGDVAR